MNFLLSTFYLQCFSRWLIAGGFFVSRSEAAGRRRSGVSRKAAKGQSCKEFLEPPRRKDRKEHKGGSSCFLCVFASWWFNGCSAVRQSKMNQSLAFKDTEITAAIARGTSTGFCAPAHPALPSGRAGGLPGRAVAKDCSAFAYCSLRFQIQW